jgi:predicted dehydrogenase
MTTDQGILQVGVIGLGRAWRRRYRPALQALRDRFAVRLLCDQVHALAAREARSLGCDAVLGPSALLESAAVEAVLLLDAQWFGLWPLEQACRIGKPVFCLDALALAEENLDHVLRQVRESRLPVMTELAPRSAWVTGALRELLAGPLGPARGVVCDFFQPQPAASGSGPADVALVDWCASMIGAEPVSVLAAGTDDGGFASLVLEFPDARRAQLTGWRTAVVWHPPRLQVVAERGWARAELPSRLCWTDAEGRHGDIRRGLPLEHVLLERFARSMRDGQPPQPDLEDVSRAVAWLHAAQRSRAEGQRVAVAEGSAHFSSNAGLGR